MSAAVELPDGQQLEVREMTLDDVGAIVGLYASLSSQDRYRRFFSAFRASESAVRSWVDEVTDHGHGLLAVLHRGDTELVVGEAFYVLLPNGDGEFAITVHPDWRGWLGPYLLDALVHAAHERGVPNLEAEVLFDNRAMLSVVRHRGHVVLPDSDYQVVRVSIGTSADGPVWPSADARPRVLLEGATIRWHGAAELAELGFDVVSCPGPEQPGRPPCPALSGHGCPLAAGADAIVIAYRPDSEITERLVAAHADLHPGVGVIVDLGAAPGAATPPGLCRMVPEGAAAKVLAALPRLAAVTVSDGGRR